MNKIQSLITILRTKYIDGFASVGTRSKVIKPLQLDNTQAIEIGDRSTVAYGAWLMGGAGKNGTTMHIGSHCSIGHFAHIVGIHSLTIEDSVLIADKVFISDCTHSFEDVTKPIIKQNVVPLKPVVIGEGSWLGENVSILGASVGKHCVIGSNSVVIKDIQDYCVAVGSPATVIRKYDFQIGQWI